MAFPGSSLMRSLLLTATFCTGAVADVSGASEFVKGAALVGGSNGMFFDAENNLYVAQVLGRTISKLNPETGQILEQLGQQDGFFFPDDVTIGNDGELYWTDVLGGTVGRKPKDGAAEFLYPFGTFPNANPLTLSDDGNRLFFAQCFNLGAPNGLYQVDLETNETTPIIEGVPLCASNAMDFKNNSIYAPILFQGRVARIDLANDNQITNVTSIGIPVAVKFDSQGRLHVLDTSNGQVLRIDLDNPDTTNNTELVAQLPDDGLDNLAFDKDDRLYVSSFSRGTVLEVLGLTNFRTVSPGSFSATSGVAILNNVLYTVHPLAVHGYDLSTAQEVTFVEAIPGVSDLMQPAAIVATKAGNLILLSFIMNSLLIWNITTESITLSAIFEAPTDALEYQNGVLVMEATTGNVVHATGDDLSNRTILMTIPGVFFLAGNETHVYATHFVNGTTLEIISNGTVLDTPTIISSGHYSPEGTALVDNYLLVACTGSGTLEKVDISSGEVATLVEGLDFLPPLPEFGLVFGFSNDVAVHDDYAYVNADGSNVLYKVNLAVDATSGVPATLAKSVVKRLLESCSLLFLFMLST